MYCLRFSQGISDVQTTAPSGQYPATLGTAKLERVINPVASQREVMSSGLMART